MPTFPTTVTPSSVSAPEVLDPMWTYEADAGYQQRRTRHSRPLRQWTLDFLGKTTDEMRQIRDFVQQQRVGVTEFGWFHPTAIDYVTVSPTTPVTVQWRHGLFTGQSVVMRSTPNTSINEAAWVITRIDEITVTLNGSVAGGVTGVGQVFLYVPRAVVVATQEGSFASPTKLIGPEQIPYGTQRGGIFSFTVTIREVF